MFFKHNLQPNFGETLKTSSCTVVISAGAMPTQPAFKKVISSMSVGQRWTPWYCVSGILEPFPLDGSPAEDPCGASVAACTWSNIKVKGSADSENLHLLDKLHPNNDSGYLLTFIMDNVLWIRTCKFECLRCIETARS